VRAAAAVSPQERPGRLGAAGGLPVLTVRPSGSRKLTSNKL
jgi:hypothetical protein